MVATGYTQLFKVWNVVSKAEIYFKCIIHTEFWRLWKSIDFYNDYMLKQVFDIQG